MSDEEDQAEDQEIQASLPQSQPLPATPAPVSPQLQVSTTTITTTPMAVDDDQPSIPCEQSSFAPEPVSTEPLLAPVVVAAAAAPVPLVASVQVYPPLLPLSLLPNPSTAAHSSIIPLDLPALECRIAVSHSSYKFTCTPPVIV